jgi:competence protein ComEC
VRFLVKPFLCAQGVNRLPALLLTHGDLRHMGGAGLLTNAFPTQQICASPVRARSPVYRRLLKNLSESPGKLRTLSRGAELGAWSVLHPEATDHFSQADDNSLVLAGNVFGTRVLLLSDLGRPGQNALLERYPELRADILVTGLPVRPEAVSDPLLDGLQPRVIIVADSELPATERASPKLRERLAQRGVLVIYTSTEGAATIEWRGETWELRTRSGMRLTSQALAQRIASRPES